MALDLFMWLFAGSVAGFSIAIVFLVMWFVQPARNSPAMYFIEAKRKKKPVVVLDEGSYWTGIVGKGVDDDYVCDKNDNQIENTPGAMKYWRGVLFGVGEPIRSKMASAAVTGIINQLVKKSITNEQAEAAMNILDMRKREEKDDEIERIPEEEAGTPAEKHPADEGHTERLHPRELQPAKGLPEVREQDGISPEAEEDG